MEQKKTAYNFRPMVVYLIVFILSCLAAIYFSYSSFSLLIILSIILIFFLLSIVLCKLCKVKILYCFAIMLLLCSFPFLNVFCRVKNVENIEHLNTQTVTIEGRICENYTVVNGTNISVCLDNVSIFDNNQKIKVNGKVILYVNAANMKASDFYAGRFVAANAYLRLYSFGTEDKYMLSSLSKGIVGTASSRFGYFAFLEKENVLLRDKIKTSAKDVLIDDDTTISYIGYSMLFGDKTVLSKDVLSTFQTTGVAHLLAVSGLHVSIIVMAISFLMKKLKLSNIVQLIILLVSLLFYSYLCDYSVSVLRAAMMAIILAYSKIRGKAYDNLSVLAFVALVLLLINPLYLFNISFILSFSAVLSIYLLTSPFNRLFRKVLKPKFASTLALNCSVQVGLTLTTAYYFGKINLLSIFCNLISVPIAVFSFMYFVGALLIVSIFPFMTFLMSIYKFVMGIVVQLNYLVCKANLIVYFTNFTIAYDVLIKVLMFMMSDYYFASKRVKCCAGVVLIATCLQVCVFIW